MSVQLNLTAALTVASLALAAAPCFAGDEVAPSFERMLAPHVAAPAITAAVSNPADPLLAALIVPLRDGPPSASQVVRAAPQDAVSASFARMLHHEPNRTAPSVPAGTPADPLIAAVVHPLLQAGQVTVAGLRVRLAE